MWSARCDMKCDKLSITFDWHSRHKDQIKVFILTPIMSYHVICVFISKQPHTFTHKSIKIRELFLFFCWRIFMWKKEQELMDGCHFLTFFCSLFIHTSGRKMLPSHVIHKSAIHSIIHSHSSSSSTSLWTCKAKNPIKRRIRVSSSSKGRRKERRINHSYFVTVILREKCSRADVDFILMMVWYWKMKINSLLIIFVLIHLLSCTFLALLDVYVNSICHLHHCRSSYLFVYEINFLKQLLLMLMRISFIVHKHRHCGYPINNKKELAQNRNFFNEFIRTTNKLIDCLWNVDVYESCEDWERIKKYEIQLNFLTDVWWTCCNTIIIPEMMLMIMIVCTQKLHIHAFMFNKYFYFFVWNSFSRSNFNGMSVSHRWLLICAFHSNSFMNAISSANWQWHKLTT